MSQPKPEPTAAPGINVWNENPLHSELKDFYAGSDGALEVPVRGFVADCVREDLLIEIQTANFGAMRRKLRVLVADHPVRLVHPIAAEKWIVREDAAGTVLGRRKSPKRGRWEEVFKELVAFPRLMLERNFTLAVVLVREEEVRVVGGTKRRRRRNWRRSRRRLLGVVSERLFATPADLVGEIPVALPFTSGDLARCLAMPLWLAQKMTYCLREMEAIERVGRKRNGIQYVIASGAAGVER